MPLSEPAPSRKLLSDGSSGMAQPLGRRLPLRLQLAGLGSLTLPAQLLHASSNAG